MHLNIHYLHPKLDELRHLIQMQRNPDVVGICETFLNNTYSDSEFYLNGYKMYRKDRQSLGGGIVLYVNDKFSCVRRNDLEQSDIESMWLDIKIPNQKTFT